jgi:hypothetical protein
LRENGQKKHYKDKQEIQFSPTCSIIIQNKAKRAYMPYLFKDLSEMNDYYEEEFGFESLPTFPSGMALDATYSFATDNKLAFLAMFRDAQKTFSDKMSQTAWKRSLDKITQEKDEVFAIADIVRDLEKANDSFQTTRPSLVYFFKNASMLIHGDVIKVALKICQLELGATAVMDDIISGGEDDIKRLLGALESPACTQDNARESLKQFRSAVKKARSDSVLLEKPENHYDSLDLPPSKLSVDEGKYALLDRTPALPKGHYDNLDPNNMYGETPSGTLRDGAYSLLDRTPALQDIHIDPIYEELPKTLILVKFKQFITAASKFMEKMEPTRDIFKNKIGQDILETTRLAALKEIIDNLKESYEKLKVLEPTDESSVEAIHLEEDNILKLMDEFTQALTQPEAQILTAIEKVKGMGLEIKTAAFTVINRQLMEVRLTGQDAHKAVDAERTAESRHEPS